MVLVIGETMFKIFLMGKIVYTFISLLINIWK